MNFMQKEKYIIIVAGGKGLRMGADIPKQFLPVGGLPVLMHTINVFHQTDPTILIILVLPEEHQSYWKELCQKYHFEIPHTIVSGGESRFCSVKNALSLIPLNVIVGVHDGVRPFVSPKVIRNCFEEAFKLGAVVPVISPVESLRKKEGKATIAVDRSDYFSVQTPQVFRSEILLKAYEQEYKDFFTDDASVVESSGSKISLVEGNPENIKVTTPFDIKVAKAILDE